MLTKAELGHLKKADASAHRHLAEFRDEAGELLGRPDGDRRGVLARRARSRSPALSKGKGFQGTIKRHNFKSGPKSHGSHNVRAPGSIGASATPVARVQGHPRPRPDGRRPRHPARPDRGRGDRRSSNLLLVRGAVPGPRGGTVEVRTDG